MTKKKTIKKTRHSKFSFKRFFKKLGKKKYLFGIAIAIILIGGGVFCYRHFHKQKTQPKVVDIYNPAQFNDIQKVQIVAAQKNGITPMQTRAELKDREDKLHKVSDCNNYKIDNLSASVPYLVPKADSLLNEIGQGFREELKNGGYRDHRIIVTSLLRSRNDVAKLQRNNKNATTNSTHCYGTTFDITYKRFDRQNLNGNPISDASLKKILIKVLRRLRQQGKCLVKYETRQHCFHITVK